MNKNFVKFLSFFIPVSSWRKNFRKRLTRHNLFGDLNDVFREIKMKRDCVLKYKNNCQAIFLGSSHGAYGINPEFINQNCFNLCSNSQDLYTACAILERLKEKLPYLRQIFLVLDVFSRGWNLERTSATHICASFTYLYGIKYNLPKGSTDYEKRCRSLDQEKYDTLSNINGYLNPSSIPCLNSVETRVKTHLREHNRSESQYGHIEKMSRIISRMRANFYLIIPPLREDYYSLLPKHLVRSDIDEINFAETPTILNFSESDDFQREDFYDYGHLNPQGTAKLSQKLKSIIK